MKKKVLLSLSGGLDSTTLLAYLQNEGYMTEAVSFYYGSKHNKYENKAAQDVADYYHTKLTEIDVSAIMQHFESNLLLSGGAIPEGHYKDENMRKTVVPSRNMIFLSILSGIAESRKIKYIAIGAHAGDHFIYPDCRPEFIGAMARVCQLSAPNTFYHILSPFLYSGKEDIVKKGVELKVPFDLTRTCYKDQAVSCGVCGSCNERLQAFADNQATDPIQYETL